MKMLLVANGNLATAMKNSLANFFNDPDIEAIDFVYPTHLAGIHQLAGCLERSLRENPEETFLVMADSFGSTAMNETSIMLEKAGLSGRSLIIPAMSLPTVFKLYGLKDSVSIEYIRNLYTEDARLLG